MKILTRLDALKEIPVPLSFAIGYFDGVHLGHQAVIHEAVLRAGECGGKSVVLTFYPHPARVLRPQDSPLMLTSINHKLDLIKELEVDYCLIIDFTPQFAQTEPEEFIRQLFAACGSLDSICVGQQWAFGHQRRGNTELIRRLGIELGFAVAEVSSVNLHGDVVSSTAIRKHLKEGDLFSVGRYLGRRYSILGEVVHGQKLGRKIGFPTANLEVFTEILPPDGVYVCWARVEGGIFPAVVNLGIKPTLSSSTSAPSVEVHMIDFERDIYGQRLEVIFKKFIRPEKKFDSLVELKEQIARDIEEARGFLAMESIPDKFLKCDL